MFHVGLGFTKLGLADVSVILSVESQQRESVLQLLTAAKSLQQLAGKELILLCVIKRLDNGLFI